VVGKPEVMEFGWPVMLLLLPVALLLPWIVQRRRNTLVGMIIHAVFNAADFMVAITDPGNSCNL
jgi:membrane protease YdiL (CAAX protease family)